MPNVKITTPDGPSPYGTIVAVDGRELQEVRGFTLRAAVDDVVTMAVELLPGPELSFEGKVDLHVSVIAMPGWEIVETTDADGTKRYRAEQLVTA